MLKLRKYNVTGMGCAACQARVEKAVSSISGVSSCSVNLLTNSMMVDGSATDVQIIKAVEDAGYGASVADADSESDDITDPIDKETSSLRKRLILSIVFLAILMYFAFSNQFPFVQMALSLVIMIINRKFFISGFKGIIHGAPNMDTLVSLGASVSFCWSIYVLIRGGGDLYFDSAAMILTLISIGKTLESKSKGKVTNAIKSLINHAPKKATLIRDGKEYIVMVSAIREGEVFIVHPGESVAVDGVVIGGNSTIDESALTGESDLIEKNIGDNVSAATINHDGLLKCKAVRVGEDTTYSQIIKMVSDASSSKAPISKLADKVSGIFVPSVIAIAVITFFIWIVIGQAVPYAIERAVSVLVISCPCALGLATPVAIMVGSGIGAKKGILFKNAESLEQTGKVKSIVFDKTGTITTGKGDVLRSDSKESIKELKNMGLNLTMLTGDKREAAEKITDSIGIDNVMSELLPGDKKQVVSDLKEEGVVVMVGDGINDALALTTADVGIAIGAGTDVAIDAADIVIMNSKLSDVVSTIKLSKLTLKTIKQNLFWAFIYNVLCIPLAAGCYVGIFGWELSPMIAAGAMSLSSLCVVLNALRMRLR